MVWYTTGFEIANRIGLVHQLRVTPSVSQAPPPSRDVQEAGQSFQHSQPSFRRTARNTSYWVWDLPITIPPKHHCSKASHAIAQHLRHFYALAYPGASPPRIEDLAIDQDPEGVGAQIIGVRTISARLGRWKEFRRASIGISGSSVQEKSAVA